MCADLADVVRAATGRHDAVPVEWWSEPVAPVRSWATAALARLRGRTHDQPWSVIVKTLQAVDATALPEALRAAAAADTTWRHEADLYRADLDDVLPAGLRMPARYRIDEPGDGRIVEWLEDVPLAPVAWDLARYARAAHLLGRLAVRLTRADRMPGSVLREPGAVLRLQWLERQALWLPRLPAGSGLLRLADRVPALLDALDALPHTYVHGDACPQNLLVPVADPDGFVAIDWSLIGPSAVGYDLGQLLIGHAHAGLLDVGDLPAVHDAILPAYRAGLAGEGLDVPLDVVRFGFHVQLVLRSAFTTLPLDHPAELAHWLVDLGLALPDGP